MTSTRNWRRTRLTRADGSPIPDDWTLEDDTGQPLGRIYFETGGPQDCAGVFRPETMPFVHPIPRLSIHGFSVYFPYKPIISAL